MSHYNTLDTHVNTTELDPCLVAEVPPKKKKRFNWKYVAGGLAILLLIVGASVLAGALLTPCKSTTPTQPTSAPTLSAPSKQIDTRGHLFESCEEYYKNGFKEPGYYRLHRPNSNDVRRACYMDPENGRP